ncbi:hypothetical protein MUK42_36972 [Musa troglodytarum]|uniref:Uncharacterized protein n=1 Tax=Musa troglodytarum TaxID=320322 RepID=A0A9E7JU76_9LILI|nr:hypothetical protein MUK42_36972 [Musa troglodytarum]
MRWKADGKQPKPGVAWFGKWILEIVFVLFRSRRVFCLRAEACGSLLRPPQISSRLDANTDGRDLRWQLRILGGEIGDPAQTNW